MAYSLRFTVDVFFGPPATDLPHTPHEPPRWMRAPVELLVFACLVVGIFPAQSGRLDCSPLRRCRSLAGCCRNTAWPSGTAGTRR